MKLDSNDRFAPSLGINPNAPETNNRGYRDDWLLASGGAAFCLCSECITCAIGVLAPRSRISCSGRGRSLAYNTLGIKTLAICCSKRICSCNYALQ